MRTFKVNSFIFLLALIGLVAYLPGCNQVEIIPVEGQENLSAFYFGPDSQGEIFSETLGDQVSLSGFLQLADLESVQSGESSTIGLKNLRIQLNSLQGLFIPVQLELAEESQLVLNEAGQASGEIMLEAWDPLAEVGFEATAYLSYDLRSGFSLSIQFLPIPGMYFDALAAEMQAVGKKIDCDEEFEIKAFGMAFVDDCKKIPKAVKDACKKAIDKQEAQIKKDAKAICAKMKDCDELMEVGKPAEKGECKFYENLGKGVYVLTKTWKFKCVKTM